MPVNRPCLYDQDQDVTPAAGYERPTTCSKGCPTPIDGSDFVCLLPLARRLYCPLGVAA